MMIVIKELIVVLVWIKYIKSKKMHIQELVFGNNGFDLFQGWVVLVMDEQVELLVGGPSGGCENFLSNILDESFAKDGVECALDKDWAVFRKRIANNQSCVGHFEIV